MRHREAVEDEAKKGDYGSAGRDDPEGGQEGKWLRGEAFTGGGDEGRDGVPCRKPASKALGACGINHRREEHPKLRDDGDASTDVAVESCQWRERQADGEACEQKRAHGKWKE